MVIFTEKLYTKGEILMNFLKKIYGTFCVCLALGVGICSTASLYADLAHKNNQVCASTRLITMLPYKITSPGEYVVDDCLTVTCEGGISVQADDVTLRFCSDGALSLKEHSIGIKIENGCNVQIIGANFEAYHNKNVDAVAVKASCVKNLCLLETKSTGVSQVLVTKQSSNVSVNKMCAEYETCERQKDSVCLITFLETDHTKVSESIFKITSEQDSSDTCESSSFSSRASSDNSFGGSCASYARHPIHKAIYLGDNINNWHVTDCVFTGFDRAICAKCFNDGTLENSTFYSCHEGLKVNKKGFVERFLCQNCRADDTTGNLSWFLSLDGQLFDSKVQHLQLTNTHLYCFQCTNCKVDDVEIDSAIITKEGVFGIQCGGPRGTDLFNLTEADKKGCTNCQISNIKCRMATLEPNSIIFIVGVGALFCQNCEISDSQILCDGGASRAYGICILESYCSECVIRRCSAVGPCVVGIQICDILDQVDFCRASLVDDCKVQDCHYGINLWRCHAGEVQNSKAKLSKIGIFVSENTTNAIVKNCQIVENEIGFLYQPLLDDALLPPTFTPDPVVGEPVNGILLKNTFAGNTQDIIDNTAGKDLNVDSSNKFF
jgi:hypothetical protein